MADVTPLPLLSPLPRRAAQALLIAWLAAPMAAPAGAQEADAPAQAPAAADPAGGSAAEQPSECKILASTGDRFCKYGHRWRLENSRAGAFQPGDDFPVYDHSMLMDLRRHGLPPVDGAWRYYLVEGMIYKVSTQDHRVLEVVGRARR